MKNNFFPYAYFEDQFVSFNEAKVSIATNALQYGTGFFGGIRGYYNHKKNALSIFRLKDHYQRFLNSTKILGVSLKYNQKQLEEITVELVKKNKPKTDVYFRPFAYASSLNISPNLTNDHQFQFALYMLPLGEYLSINKGLKVKVSSYRRVTDNAIPSRAKISGAYINSALAAKEARDLGFDEAIFLTEDGHVAEGSAENLFLIKNGKLITSAESEEILEGITRRSIIQMAKDIGIEVEIRRVDRTELYTAEEMFFCGTGVQVAWIAEVDGRIVGNGKRGLITAKIQDMFFKVVKGEVKKYQNWCTLVKV